MRKSPNISIRAKLDSLIRIRSTQMNLHAKSGLEMDLVNRGQDSEVNPDEIMKYQGLTSILWSDFLSSLNEILLQELYTRFQTCENSLANPLQPGKNTSPALF